MTLSDYQGVNRSPMTGSDQVSLPPMGSVLLSVIGRLSRPTDPLLHRRLSDRYGRVVPMADADIIVVGAGLAGLVAAAEAADAGRSVVVLDQEGAASVGGQAWWSLGGLSSSTPPSSGASG